MSTTSSSASKPSGGWQPPTLEDMQAMLPQYQFESLLGRGGMGAVYKAVQVSLDRTVAIKVLPGDLIDDMDAQFAERFKNEARTMAKMNHPAIVNVYDFGETQTGLLFIVMEFIDGTDVSKMIISQGKLPEDYALSITAHVCDALNYAHRHGVIHRDIKPANILINMEGAVKVADFGLAKQSEAGQSGLTKTNMAMGTPDFVAPEALIPGIPLDGRADLYAIGVMLYQMLTGEIPRGIWSLPGTKLGTDPRFDSIITKAMQTDREARYQSAADLRRDLDTILTTPRAMLQQAAVAQPPAQRPLSQKTPEATKPAVPRPKKSALGPILGISASVVLLIGIYVVFKPPAPSKTTGSSSTGAAAVPSPETTPVPATPPPTPPPGAAKQTIDLLALTDVARDKMRAEGYAGANRWSKTDGGISFVTDGKSGKISAPVALNGLRDYEVETEVRDTSDPGITLDFPTSATNQATVDFRLGVNVTLAVDAKQQQYAFGDWPKDAALSSKLVGRVTFDDDGVNGTISVTVNGTSVGSWHGDLTKLGKSAEAHPEFPGQLVPALFIYRGNRTYASWTLRVFDGEARVLREPGAPPPPADILSFSGHRYQLVMGSTTWNVAKDRAASMGGHLATVTSAEEHDFITAKFRDAIAQRGHFWIGGFRDAGTAEWQWVTGEPFGFKGWAPSQPDADEKHYCTTAYWRSSNTDWGWDDAPGNSLAKDAFLLEWDDDGQAKPAVAAAPSAPANVSPAMMSPSPTVPATAPSASDLERIVTFRGHRYQLLKDPPRNWSDIVAKARSLGAHLGTLTSPEENDFILKAYASWLNSDSINSILIGASQEKQDSPWTWVTGETFEYAGWKPGEPNRASGDGGSEDVPYRAFFHSVGWDDKRDGVPSAFMLIEWDADPRADPRIAQLDKGFTARRDSDAQQPYLTALAKLNQGYLTAGIPKARAAVQAKGSLAEVTALDAEKTLVEKGGSVPAEDAADTPASLKSLRATYRGALAKITAERDAKAAPLYDLYLKALDAYTAELTKGGKTDAAGTVQAFRDDIAKQKPVIAATPATSIPAKTTAAPAPASKATGGGSSWRVAADYLVKNGGTFVAFKNGGTGTITKAAEIPPGRFDIHEINFDRLNSVLPPAKDAEFAAFNGLRDLRRVWFRPMTGSLSDAAFTFLANNPELVFINFEGVSGLTDGILTHIAGLKKLDYLAVQYAENFTGRGLEKIVGASSITNLELLGSGITDEGLRAVSTFKKLQSIRLTSPKVTAGGYAALANVKSLASLNVSGGVFDDETAGIVATMPNLAALDLGATKVTDAGLSKLKTLKKLTSLNLGGTAVTPEAAAEFQKAMPQCRVSR